ncbi:hypothetical protein LCGC14_1336260 [marine sediment metagenome]|uniref:Uncharacterized protein n=1 Tax=marine sediment metagenome TaxID=412755 RepID=A0A0F9NHI5_9ZZZZ
MIKISKKKKKIVRKDEFGNPIRNVGNFTADSWNFKNVKKVFARRGYRGQSSRYNYTAKAYWKDTKEYAGKFKMSAKNLKDLKGSIKAESDWVHIQLKRSKERNKR